MVKRDLPECTDYVPPSTIPRTSSLNFWQFGTSSWTLCTSFISNAKMSWVDETVQEILWFLTRYHNENICKISNFFELKSKIFKKGKLYVIVKRTTIKFVSF